MNAHNRYLGGTRRRAVALLGVMLLLVPAIASLTIDVNSASAHDTFADPAFQRVWNHCDKPVESQIAARSWMWGPQDYYTTYEPYAQGPGGQHLVSYFDKSRMEINDPSSNRSSEWFVTNGLLVVEMMSGRIQVGDNAFMPATPANVPVAGDTGASLNAPTYATLAGIASLKNDNRAPDRTGQYVQEGVGSTGNVGMVDGGLSTLARDAVYEATLGHNIPDVFWAFMNQRGVTYHMDSGYMPNDVVVDWMFAMGYPITEPYWIQIGVNGQQRWVLMQAFQRRILTYSPYNPDPWKVEMANVGRAYFDWRYGVSSPPAPLPTPIPAATATATATVAPRPQAAVSIYPGAGDTNTLIKVEGAYFPARSAVTIRVEKSSTGYSRDVATSVTNADGAFAVQIKVPVDAARLGEVQITAIANGGAVRASRTFKLTYEPAITVSPREVVANGTVRVQGVGFPAKNSVRLGMLYENGMMQWISTPGTDGAGAFDTKLNVGNLAVGTRFTVVATMDGGYKAVSTYKVTVTAQPALQVVPSSGPAGVYVTLKGSSWQANRSIQLGIRAIGSPSEAWWPDPVTTDAAGNFSKQIWIGPEYRPYSELHLMAQEAVSMLRLEVSYRIVSPPLPTPTAVAAIIIAPTVLTVGQEVAVYGTGWPANASVSLGLGRTAVEEPVGTARAATSGTFAHRFVISSRWQAGGQLTLLAWVPTPKGPSASTTLWVGPGASAGRVTPSGLSMWVSTYQYKSDSVTIKVRGEGWRPGQSVSLDVISADGALNVPVVSAGVGSDGTFRTTFQATAGTPWWGRPDVGVRAVAQDGKQFSIRYLPFIEAVKVAGGTYQVRGVNWPAGTSLSAIAHVDSNGQHEDVDVGATTTDLNGAFNMLVQMPRVSTNNKNDLEIIPKEQPYGAVLDF